MSFFDGFALSSQGYNHIKDNNKECQDASGIEVNGTTAIIVVADGHGSDNYPRTRVGAEYAVEAAILSIKRFIAGLKESSEAFDLDDGDDLQLINLSKNILMNWHSRVEEHYTCNPFTEEELLKVSEKHKKMYLSKDPEQYAKAYGTTLIAICITQDYWFGIHLGDGKCISFDDELICSEPIPWDEDCQANITTSLCDTNAINEFRFYKSKELPLAVFIGSDGIDDSYANDIELQNLYRTIMLLLVENDIVQAKAEVESFLSRLTRDGSGDDVSIAGLIRNQVPDGINVKIKARIDYENALLSRTKLEKELRIAEEKVSYIQAAMQRRPEEITSDEEKLKKAQKECTSIADELSNVNERLHNAELDLNNVNEIIESEGDDVRASINQDSPFEQETEIFPTEPIDAPSLENNNSSEQ